MLFVGISSMAQQSTSSPYSLYGLGLENFNGSIANRSLGGLSLYSDVVAPNLQNPATYSDIKLTSFGVGTTYTATNIIAEEGTGKGKATTLDYLAINIPAGKFGFGIGLRPYRSVGYDIEGSGNDEVIGDFEQSLEGSGNVNRVYLGAGTEVYKGLKLGAEFQYNFGRLEEQTTKFGETTFSTRVINQSDVSGVSYTLSAIYDYPIEKDFVMRSSLVYDFSSNIKSTNVQERATVSSNNGIIFAEEDSELFGDEFERKFQLPSRLSAGLSFTKLRKWFFGTEAYLTENNDFQDRFEDREGVEYVDGFGVKVGGFYIPKFNSLTSYLSKVTYRAGLHYDSLGLEINGTDINEFGISFGLGLPLLREFSTLDVGFEVGSRGRVTDVLVKENYFAVSLGLSLGQKWFKQRKFD